MAISTEMTAEERINLYRNEITKRTPPVDKHDSFMLKVYQTLLDSALEVTVAAPPDAVVVEGVRHLYLALDRLDADSRLAFVLRHVEGHDLLEVANACGCSLATVKRRLARAEKRFQAIASGDPVLREFITAEGRGG